MHIKENKSSPSRPSPQDAEWSNVRAHTSQHSPARSSIRSRLLVAFSLLVLLPITTSTIISNLSSSRSLQKRTIDQLEPILMLKETRLREWINNLHDDVIVALPRDEETDYGILAGRVSPRPLDETGAPYLVDANYARLTMSHLEEFTESGRIELTVRPSLLEEELSSIKVEQAASLVFAVLGAFDYLDKPVDADQLIKKLKQLERKAFQRSEKTGLI